MTIGLNQPLNFYSNLQCSRHSSFVVILPNVYLTGKEKYFWIRYLPDNQGLPYDYDSRMHYGSWYYQKAPGLNTIVPTDPNVDIHRLGSREVSAWDKMHINIRYCPGKNFGEIEQ